MADLQNFSVTQVGQQVVVKGDVYEGTTKVNSFGPNGTSFVSWFQQLPVSAQIEFVNSVAISFMIRNLLGQWPISIPNGRQSG